MMCFVCVTKRPLAGGLWSTAHEAVAICHHCGAGLCAEHAHRAEAPGSPLYCEECFAVEMAQAPAAQAPVAQTPVAQTPVAQTPVAPRTLAAVGAA